MSDRSEINGTYYLRPVVLSDRDLLLKWVNDKSVRENAFNQEQIAIDEHSRWFNNALSSDNIFIYILMHNDEHIGQCRITVKDEVADIDYSIDSSMRGKGLGKIILDLLEQEIRNNYREISKLVGRVKPGNVLSIRCFEENDYTESYRVFEKELKRAEPR